MVASAALTHYPLASLLGLHLTCLTKSPQPSRRCFRSLALSLPRTLVQARLRLKTEQAITLPIRFFLHLLVILFRTQSTFQLLTRMKP